MLSEEPKKSSYSASGACVEVAFRQGVVVVGDTKDRAKPPHTYTPIEWGAFLLGVKDGEFDLPPR